MSEEKHKKFETGQHENARHETGFRPAPHIRPSTRVRPARLGDLPRILELERLCFDGDTQESEEVYRERIETFPEGFLVLETAPDDHGDVSDYGETPLAGFICSELWLRSTHAEPAPVTAELFSLGHSIRERFSVEGNELYISSLAVEPAYRGKGYGELLFQTLNERIRSGFPKVESIILLVGERWIGARKIYERAGFTTVGILKDFFGGDSVESYDGIVMRK